MSTLKILAQLSLSVSFSCPGKFSSTDLNINLKVQLDYNFGKVTYLSEPNESCKFKLLGLLEVRHFSEITSSQSPN